MIGMNPSLFSSGLGGLVALVGTEIQVEIAHKGHLLAILNGELLAANDVAAADADVCEESCSPSVTMASCFAVRRVSMSRRGRGRLCSTRET
jgi:hypothetical protein